MVAGNAQIRRSFQQYSDVAVISSAFGNSNYHALNLRLEKRYSSGLHFQTNYTFGKSIDDVASRKSARRVGRRGRFSEYLRSPRRPRPLGQRPQPSLFVELGVRAAGRQGKAFDLKNAALNQILGGWSTGLIAEFRTGPPWGVVEQVNGTNAFSPSQRPNLASGRPGY